MRLGGCGCRPNTTNTYLPAPKSVPQVGLKSELAAAVAEVAATRAEAAQLHVQVR